MSQTSGQVSHVDMCLIDVHEIGERLGSGASREGTFDVPLPCGCSTTLVQQRLTAIVTGTLCNRACFLIKSSGVCFASTAKASSSRRSKNEYLPVSPRLDTGRKEWLLY